MYWVSVIVLGILHYCFHKGRWSKPVEKEAVAASPETSPDHEDGTMEEQETVAASAETPPDHEEGTLPDPGFRDDNGETTEAPMGTLETESDPWQRHLIYTRNIEAVYRKRKASDDAHDRAIDLSEKYINELQDLKPAVFERFGDEPKVILAFKLLTIILEEDGEYDRAVAICQAALANGIDDGTKTGFEGRIGRIFKKKAAMNAK
jgi:hypothetical protein